MTRNLLQRYNRFLGNEKQTLSLENRDTYCDLHLFDSDNCVDCICLYTTISQPPGKPNHRSPQTNRPPKGKVSTKGQKQIVAENKSTLQYYLYIIGGVNALYFVVQVLLFWESYTALNIFLSLLAGVVYFGSYKFMASMAKATYAPDGSLIDGGIDINMESGMGEHSKDLIILTAIVQTLSLISRYFWLLWLLAPGWAFYLLWVNILGPWFFQPAPEVDEKKAKKMERKMKRR